MLKRKSNDMQKNSKKEQRVDRILMAFTQFEIYERIFSHVHSTTLFSLMRVCKDINEVVKASRVWIKACPQTVCKYMRKNDPIVKGEYQRMKEYVENWDGHVVFEPIEESDTEEMRIMQVEVVNFQWFSTYNISLMRGNRQNFG